MRMQVPAIFIHYHHHHRVLKMAIAQKPTRTSGHHQRSQVQLVKKGSIVPTYIAARSEKERWHRL